MRYIEIRHVNEDGEVVRNDGGVAGGDSLGRNSYRLERRFAEVAPVVRVAARMCEVDPNDEDCDANASQLREMLAVLIEVGVEAGVHPANWLPSTEDVELMEVTW